MLDSTGALVATAPPPPCIEVMVSDLLLVFDMLRTDCQKNNSSLVTSSGMFVGEAGPHPVMSPSNSEGYMTSGSGTETRYVVRLLRSWMMF